MSHRLTREQWLDKALAALVDVGIKVLTIEHLVRHLGVTRGSFYWHFDNRNDFIRALVEHWENKYTVALGEAIDKVSGSAAERLKLLMARISEECPTEHDIAVRAWAAYEPHAAEAVRRVDRFRYDFVRSLFAEMGFSGDDLEMRTRTFVVFHSMDPGFSLQEDASRKQKRLELRHEFFTRR